jgi:uncharacterized protein YeaO (DUF488 family)
MFKIKRVYDPPEPADGLRFLVDRLWPRGVRKDTLQLAGWLKELAPSDDLRRWFGHDPARWQEFCQRYRTELAGQEAAWRPLLETGRTEIVTLLFAAHDVDHNNAVALRSFLEQHLADQAHKSGIIPPEEQDHVL